MMNTQRIGGWAALLNAGVAAGNLWVVLVVLGPTVAANPASIAPLIMTRPAPLLWLECFKLLAAWASLIVLCVLYHQLRPSSPQVLPIATLSGLMAALLLLLAGWIGLGALFYARYDMGSSLLRLPITDAHMNRLITTLGLAALFANGLWLWGVCWVARKTGHLPVGLCRLGFLLGSANVLALAARPVALLALCLGLIWSLWLGGCWLRGAALQAGQTSRNGEKRCLQNNSTSSAPTLSV
ncbi:MAG: hypothetical protein U0350_47680 [Caldilineaceae bacterium]